MNDGVGHIKCISLLPWQKRKEEKKEKKKAEVDVDVLRLDTLLCFSFTSSRCWCIVASVWKKKKAEVYLI